MLLSHHWSGFLYFLRTYYRTRTVKVFSSEKKELSIIRTRTYKLKCPLEYASDQPPKKAIYAEEKGRILLFLPKKLYVLKYNFLILSFPLLMVPIWLVECILTESSVYGGLHLSTDTLRLNAWVLRSCVALSKLSSLVVSIYLRTSSYCSGVRSYWLSIISFIKTREG